MTSSTELPDGMTLDPLPTFAPLSALDTRAVIAEVERFTAAIEEGDAQVGREMLHRNSWSEFEGWFAPHVEIVDIRLGEPRVEGPDDVFVPITWTIRRGPDMTVPEGVQEHWGYALDRQPGGRWRIRSNGPI